VLIYFEDGIVCESYTLYDYKFSVASVNLLDFRFINKLNNFLQLHKIQNKFSFKETDREISSLLSQYSSPRYPSFLMSVGYSFNTTDSISVIGFLYPPIF
jgi:hypothetical protein